MTNPTQLGDRSEQHDLGEVVISSQKYSAKAVVGSRNSSEIHLSREKISYDISFNINVNYNPEDKKSFKFNIGFTGNFSRDNLIELLPQIKPAILEHNKLYSMGCLPDAIAYIESVLNPKKEDNLEEKTN